MESVVFPVSFMIFDLHFFFSNSYRFHFGEIKILIPKNWTQKDSYENAQQESKDQMDILIAKESPNPIENMPFTLNYRTCGDIGEYSRFTDTFMLNATEAAKFGPREKVSYKVSLWSQDLNFPRIGIGARMEPPSLWGL